MNKKPTHFRNYILCRVKENKQKEGKAITERKILVNSNELNRELSRGNERRRHSST